MSGTLELSHVTPDGIQVQRCLDPGSAFGEESLIDGRPSVFTARTLARSWIMLLSREDYLELSEHHPPLAHSLKDVARRRRKALEQATRGELDLSTTPWPDFDPNRRSSAEHAAVT
jgi:CRP-like cAMP-binding protein